MWQVETTWEMKKNKYCHYLSLFVLLGFFSLLYLFMSLIRLATQCCTVSLLNSQRAQVAYLHLCRKAIIREFPSPFIRSSSAILSWVFLPLKKCLQIFLLCMCCARFNWSLCWFQWTTDIKEENSVNTKGRIILYIITRDPSGHDFLAQILLPFRSREVAKVPHYLNFTVAYILFKGAKVLFSSFPTLIYLNSV